MIACHHRYPSPDPMLFFCTDIVEKAPSNVIAPYYQLFAFRTQTWGVQSSFGILVLPSLFKIPCLQFGPTIGGGTTDSSCRDEKEHHQQTDDDKPLTRDESRAETVACSRHVM
jgi:hypothetical protein